MGATVRVVSEGGGYWYGVTMGATVRVIMGATVRVVSEGGGGIGMELP